MGDSECMAMNDVGKPCAGKPHARFERGPLAKRNAHGEMEQAPDEKSSGLSPPTYRRTTSQRPTSQLGKRADLGIDEKRASRDGRGRSTARLTAATSLSCSSGSCRMPSAVFCLSAGKRGSAPIQGWATFAAGMTQRADTANANPSDTTATNAAPT